MPPGESRIGSDEACQICIRGEGILPVHAYLSTDGQALLIRPAGPGGSRESGSAVGSNVYINGEAVSGPVTVSQNADIRIGAVNMRLQVKRPALWAKPWIGRSIRICAWGAVCLLLLTAVLYAVLRWVILDKRRLAEALAKNVQEYLLRDCEPSDIGAIEVDPFRGVARITDLKIRDRENFFRGSGQRPFIFIPSATISLEVWPWLRSWRREYQNLRIVLANPEVNIERSRSDGTLNIRDILSKYAHRMELGLVQLDATLEVSGGVVRLRDNYTNIGETSLEDISLRLRQPGQGQPLQIEQCEMKVNAIPAPVHEGTLSLSGHLNLLDAASVVDLANLSDSELHLGMTDFDLARIFEHLGYAWEPYGMDFKVVLGKPLNGKLAVNISDANHLRLKGDGIESASLVSIREKDRPPLGNIPMGLNFDLSLARNGERFLPDEMSIGLRSGADLRNLATQYLSFSAYGRLNPGGTSEYTANLECNLQDLLGTDVGRRLGLEGRLGGRLQGNAKVIGERNGAWTIEAKMGSADAFAMVANPNDPSQPPVRQPLPLHFESHASAQPTPGSRLPDIVVESFKVRAPSFEAHSAVPGLIKGLDRKGELTAQAKFKLSLQGREFWRDFKPILALFGFTQPVEEIFDLEVTLVGSHDFIQLIAAGKAARQWNASDPAPVELRTYLSYNRRAATLPRPPTPSRGGEGERGREAEPYLELMLEAAGKEAKPLKVRVDAFCRRTNAGDLLTLERFAENDRERKVPLPGLVIQSDIVALRERFKPYIEGYLLSHDRRHNTENNGWLKFYRATALTGEIVESGRIVFKRMLDPKAQEPDVADFDLNLSCKNLDAKVPLAAAGGAERPPLTWQENDVSIALKGAYAERMMDNKEEPDTQKLAIEHLDVKGSVGAFLLKLQDLDLFKLSHLRELRSQTWTDCLAGLSMAGRLDPPAYDFARSLGLLAPDNPFCGTLALQIAFDRQKDSLDLRKFEFQQAEPKEKSFLNLDVSGALVNVRELSTKLFPAGDETPLNEHVAGFLQETGPTGLLDHLGEELTVNSLQVESGPFLAWLCKDYVSGARPPPLLLAGLLRKDWQPEGTWGAAGVKLSRQGDARARTWKLVGAKLRNDFTCYGAPLKPGGERPAVLAISHDWVLRMGVSVDANNNVMLAGEMEFDNTYLAAPVPALAYEYKKPAGEKCRLELSDCGYSQTPGKSLLAHIGRLKLTGKPVAVELKDFDADYTRSPAGTFQLSEMIIAGGPLPCAITTARYDPGGDSFQARLNAPAVDSGLLAKLVSLPATVTASGVLKDVSASYKGSLISLRTTAKMAFNWPGAEPNPATQAQMFPNLEPNDPRLLGLNPEADMLELDANAEDLGLVARGAEGARAQLLIGGHLHLTARDLACKDLQLKLDDVKPQRTLKQVCAGRTLLVNSTDARLNLLRALKAPGPPLSMNADLVFSTALDPAPWLSAYETFAAALGTAPSPLTPRPSGERGAADAPVEWRFAPLVKLVASGKISAPEVCLCGKSLSSVQVPEFALRDLKLNTPGLATDCYGGKLTLSDALFDLSEARALRSGDRIDLKGVRFKTRLKVAEADLQRILGPADSSNAGFSFSGRLDAQGNLDGMDFAGMDRHTWDGAVKLKLSGLRCQAPRAAEKPAGILPPWAASFAALGPRFCPAFAAAVSHATVNAAELGKELPMSDPLKAANGLALLLQAYLARTFGVEVERLEFDPGAPTIMITKGFVTLDRCQLVGRGPCEGVDLDLINLKINLADEDFADELRVNLTLLPKTAQAALNLDRWPAAVRDEYQRALQDGKLALRVYGRLAGPSVAFPWAQLRSLGRRALFGAASVGDLASLEQARQHLFLAWGRLPQDLAAAAALGDRLGVGLPATVMARNEGETIIDRVPGLPPSLMQCLDKAGPVLSPVESLNKLLFPEPPPPPAPGVGNKGKVERNVQK